MQEILDGWAKVLADKRLPQALDAGRAGVVHLLGDVVDNWLQTAIPAYATAVALCKQTQELDVFDCDIERLRLRDAALLELLKLTGLIKLVDALVSAWREIPKVIRENAAEIVQRAGTVADLIADPSVGKFYDAAAAAAEVAMLWVGPVLQDVWEGVLESIPIKKWLTEVSSLIPEDVINVLDRWGVHLGDNAQAAIRNIVAEATHSGKIGDIVVATTTWVINPAGAISAAADVAGDVIDAINPF